jgi:hypothetical protein
VSWWAENRELFNLNEIIDVDMVRHIHIMWDVDKHLALTTFLFFLPGLGERPVQIAHPAETMRADEPAAEQRPSDIPESHDDEEYQDLDEIGDAGGE